jgi:hypothetical protein
MDVKYQNLQFTKRAMFSALPEVTVVGWGGCITSAKGPTSRWPVMSVAPQPAIPSRMNKTIACDATPCPAESAG